MAKVDKYKKVSNKGVIIFTCCILVLIVAILCILLIPTKKERIYNKYKSYDNNTLTANHILKEESAKSLVKVLEKSNGYVFVYFGTYSCTNCRAAIGNINDTLVEAGVKTIYYLEANSDYKLSSADENRITAYVENNNMVNDSKYTFEADGTPQVWVFKDGKLVDSSTRYEIKNADDTTTVKWNYFLNEVCKPLLENK